MIILTSTFWTQKLNRYQFENLIPIAPDFLSSLDLSKLNKKRYNVESANKIKTRILITSILMATSVPAYGNIKAIAKCDFNQITAYKPYNNNYAEEHVTKFDSIIFKFQDKKSIFILDIDGVSWRNDICKNNTCSISSKLIEVKSKHAGIATLDATGHVQKHSNLSWSLDRETGLYSFLRVNIFEIPGHSGETITQKEERHGFCYEIRVPIGSKSQK